MFIYLPEVRQKNGSAVDYRFEEKLADCFDDFAEKGIIFLQLSAACSGNEVIVFGCLTAKISAECSRCLDAIEHSFKTDFQEAFTVVDQFMPDAGPAAQAVETANNLTVFGDYLYLDEYLRQLIILAGELSPLCSPDCKGICSGCGVELNRAECCCEKEEGQFDFRLLKLKELKNGC